MTDEQCTKLVELLHLYVTSYPDDAAGLTIPALVGDLTESLDVPSRVTSQQAHEITAAVA